MDATSLKVCHNKRISSHKVFKNVAARGKTSVNWFFGLKLHLVINDQLRNISQIEHSRHRSPVNCFVNILCGLIAYCHQPKKPGIAMEHNLLASA